MRLGTSIVFACLPGSDAGVVEQCATILSSAPEQTAGAVTEACKEHHTTTSFFGVDNTAGDCLQFGNLFRMAAHYTGKVQSTDFCDLVASYSKQTPADDPMLQDHATCVNSMAAIMDAEKVKSSIFQVCMSMHGNLATEQAKSQATEACQKYEASLDRASATGALDTSLLCKHLAKDAPKAPKAPAPTTTSAPTTSSTTLASVGASVDMFSICKDSVSYVEKRRELSAAEYKTVSFETCKDSMVDALPLVASNQDQLQAQVRDACTYFSDKATEAHLSGPVESAGFCTQLTGQGPAPAVEKAHQQETQAPAPVAPAAPAPVAPAAPAVEPTHVAAAHPAAHKAVQKLRAKPMQFKTTAKLPAHYETSALSQHKVELEPVAVVATVVEHHEAPKVAEVSTKATVAKAHRATEEAAPAPEAPPAAKAAAAVEEKAAAKVAPVEEKVAAKVAPVEEKAAVKVPAPEKVEAKAAPVEETAPKAAAVEEKTVVTKAAPTDKVEEPKKKVTNQYLSILRSKDFTQTEIASDAEATKEAGKDAGADAMVKSFLDGYDSQKTLASKPEASDAKVAKLLQEAPQKAKTATKDVDNMIADFLTTYNQE